MSGGSPEQALLSAMAGKIAHYVDLTGGTAAGMTVPKVADAQAGAEKALNHALVGNSGANLIYESAGMHASLLGFSLESLVLDNDVIGAAQRTIRAVRVDDETLSFETIRDVCLHGPGHYLGSEQTLRLMERDYVYPLVGDRRSPNEWTENGAEDALTRAHRKLADILSHSWPAHINNLQDESLRSGGLVKLPRHQMRG